MTQVIINPGSGPVASGPRQVSQNNIRQFIEDLGVPADWEFVSENKDGKAHIPHHGQGRNPRG